MNFNPGQQNKIKIEKKWREKWGYYFRSCEIVFWSNGEQSQLWKNFSRYSIRHQFLLYSTRRRLLRPGSAEIDTSSTLGTLLLLAVASSPVSSVSVSSDTADSSTLWSCLLKKARRSVSDVVLERIGNGRTKQRRKRIISINSVEKWLINVIIVMITLPYKSTHGFLEESQRHVLDFGAKISCTEFIGYRLASKYSKCDLIRRCFKCARTPLDTYKGISRQPPRPKLVIIRRNPVVVECCFCWALNYAFSWFHKIMYGTRSHLSLFYLNISLARLLYFLL